MFSKKSDAVDLKEDKKVYQSKKEKISTLKSILAEERKKQFSKLVSILEEQLLKEIRKEPLRDSFPLEVVSLSKLSVEYLKKYWSTEGLIVESYDGKTLNILMPDE